jgi:hypothetical protein
MDIRTIPSVVLLFFSSVSVAVAGTLLTFQAPVSGNSFDNNRSIHGWEFLVNQPITVTHLGLYDDQSDGLDIATPVGLFRLSDGELLTSGIISAGTSDPLIDLFRYVDVTDATLAAGEEYVLAQYTNDPLQTNHDAMLEAYDVRTVDPAITLGLGRFQGNLDSLSLPTRIDSRGVYFVGPNALFTAVPISPVGWLLAPAFGAIIGKRRRVAH